MPLYIFVRFEPRSGKERQLLDELLRVLEPTRAEPGCVRIHLYESTGESPVFYIHSEWIDEDAFNAHVELPHTRRLIGAVEELIAHPFSVERTRQIG